jgi:hypothetical protein
VLPAERRALSAGDTSVLLLIGGLGSAGSSAGMSTVGCTATADDVAADPAVLPTAAFAAVTLGCGAASGGSTGIASTVASGPGVLRPVARGPADSAWAALESSSGALSFSPPPTACAGLAASGVPETGEKPGPRAAEREPPEQAITIASIHSDRTSSEGAMRCMVSLRLPRCVVIRKGNVVGLLVCGSLSTVVAGGGSSTILPFGSASGDCCRTAISVQYLSWCGKSRKKRLFCLKKPFFISSPACSGKLS